MLSCFDTGMILGRFKWKLSRRRLQSSRRGGLFFRAIAYEFATASLRRKPESRACVGLNIRKETTPFGLDTGFRRYDGFICDGPGLFLRGLSIIWTTVNERHRNASSIGVRSWFVVRQAHQAHHERTWWFNSKIERPGIDSPSRAFRLFGQQSNDTGMPPQSASAHPSWFVVRRDHHALSPCHRGIIEMIVSPGPFNCL